MAGLKDGRYLVFPTLEISLTREYLLILRDGLLKQVDAVERMLGISPRTSELRQLEKARLFHEQVGDVVTDDSGD